jgi:hypothetical protein
LKYFDFDPNIKTTLLAQYGSASPGLLSKFKKGPHLVKKLVGELQDLWVGAVVLAQLCDVAPVILAIHLLCQ